MTDQEVNKIIAEFMDYVEINTSVGVHWQMPDGKGQTNTLFTKSLDALVPVWEKLDEHNPFIEFRCNQDFSKSKHYFYFNYIDKEVGQEIRGSIQQAAAYATAKAIQELDANL